MTYFPPPEHWTDLALCVEVPADLFFPEPGHPASPATAICRTCESRVSCLEDALSRPGEEGVWGGFTDRARRRVAAERDAGKTLEDIIAADDARHYARIEAVAERGTYRDRRAGIEREAWRLKREAIKARQEVAA
jgi:WhiB family transcriptional regulator, redox-sensing transcriptional regulator